MENPFLEKHILTSVEIVRSYLFDKPFHLYLKEVFRNHKNWGSKDRRNYKKYCYLILKNAGTLGKYLQSDVADFAGQWKQHFGDLPVCYWPICIFNLKIISKLSLVELNYFDLEKDYEKGSEFDNNKLDCFNSEIDPIKRSDSHKITSNDSDTRNSSLIHSDWVEEKLHDLEWIKSHSNNVYHFNKSIVDWILELEKGNYVWDAYSALQFSTNQTIQFSVDFLQNSYENHENLNPNFISKGLDISRINMWFQNEAPVFYLDKNTGINQEFAPNSNVNEWVDSGLGIIQDRSSTQSIQFLLENINKQLIDDFEVSLKFNIDPENTETHFPNQELNVTNQELNFPKKENKHQTLKVWDCCSGAGGKSLSFQIQFQHQFNRVNRKIHDELFKSNWICTDIRQTIIDNLKKRFNLLGLILPKAIQLDLLDDSFESLDTNILESNLIIADLPCSGSGTWRRTPEELLKTTSVTEYAKRQFQIIENVLKIKSKKRNGSPYYIYYMTCSVFALENEKNIDLLLEKHSELECIWQNFFGGYLENADFIYGAFIKVH